MHLQVRAYDGRVSQGPTVSRAVAKLHVAALINPQGPNFENGYKLACFFSRPLLLLNFSDHLIKRIEVNKDPLFLLIYLASSAKGQ